MANKRVEDIQILRAINDLKGDYNPSMLEVGEVVGMCKSGVFKRVKVLEEQGLVKNTKIKRGMSLTEEGKLML